MRTKKFEYRRSESSNQIAVKESFSVLDNGDYYSFSMVVGIDSTFKYVKPAIYTRNGFQALTSILKTSLAPENTKQIEEQINQYLKSKRGTYSVMFTNNNGVQGTTALLCVISGKKSKTKEQDGKWGYLGTPHCDLYVPYNITEDYLMCRCITSSDASVSKKERYFYENVAQELLVKTAPLISNSRAKFLTVRTMYDF